MLSRFAPVVLFVSMLVPQQLSAQGIFRPFGFPKTVIATGHTEVVGSVHVALTLGTTVADTLVIDVSPLKLTNANAADIQLTLAGNVTVGAVTLDKDNNRVLIPVNAGGSTGSIRVDGIRVSVAGTNRSSVTARVSWLGRANYIDGADVVTVVDQVQSGLAVDAMTDTFRIYANTVLDGTATLVLREGFKSAFVNSTAFGENVPTRIRVRVTDFPNGLKMLFPAAATSTETAATLTTVEGTAIELPRADGSKEVIYNFNGAGNSADVLESFKIPFTVSTSGTVEILQPTIDVSLATIGLDVPTTAVPTTNIPRFAEENLIVLEGTSRIITKTLYWTGVETSRSNTLSLFNPDSRIANLILTAFNSAGQAISGTNITNPVRQSLAANQSSNQSLTSIFGSGAMNVATVRVESAVQNVVALATSSATGVAASLGLVDRGLPGFTVPFLNEDTRIYVFNPSSSAVTGTLEIRSQSGTTLATTSINLAAMASDSRALRDLVGSVSTGGQILGSFTAPVIASTAFGTATTLNFVAAQAPNLTGSLYVPFFASGAGYESDLDLVNSSSQTVTATVQLVNAQGAAVGTARTVTLAPMAQSVTTVSQLFGLSGFTMGYVRIRVPERGFGPFISYPAVTGFVRIRSGEAASTAIPFALYPQTESSVLNSGTSASTYQGLALLNPNSTATDVTLQAIGATGAVIGTATVNLAAGQIASKQVSEYFTVAIPEGSVIRVSSGLPVVTTSITGSTSGDTLRSAPGLR